MENLEKKEVTLYRSNIVLFGLMVFSGLIGLTAYTSIFRDKDISSQVFTPILVGRILVFLCGLICIWSFYRLFFKGPILIINSEYMYTPKTGKVLWSNIEKIGVKSSGKPAWWMPRRYGIQAQPIIYVCLKSGKVFRIDTCFYILSTIDILKTLHRYKPVISLENSSEFFNPQIDKDL